MEKYQLLLRFDGEGYSIIKYDEISRAFSVFIPTLYRRQDAEATCAALNAADK